MQENQLIITDKETSSSGTSPKQESLSLRGLNLVKGAIGLLGLTSILYGIGFLVLRSHYSFLGFWGGVPVSSTEVAEEGGRFLFQLIYIPITLLYSLTSLTGVKTLGAVLLIALLWDLGRNFARHSERLPRFFSHYRSKLPTRVYALLALVPTVLLLLLLFGNAMILETVWQVVDIRDVLRTPNEIYRELNLQDAQARVAMYTNVMWRVVIVGIVVWYCWIKFWLGAGKLQRFLIVANGVLLLAALSSVPVVYGKLMMPTTYRTFNPSGSPPDACLVLITHTANSWVLWDANQKVTKLLPRNDKDAVSIGSHMDLLLK